MEGRVDDDDDDGNDEIEEILKVKVMTRKIQLEIDKNRAEHARIAEGKKR